MRNPEPCWPLSHACSRGERLYLCTAFCDELYVHKCVVRVGVLSTLPVGLSPGQPKLVLNLRRKFHEWPDREECQEFQLLVVQLSRSPFVDEDDGDEGDKFPCAS